MRGIAAALSGLLVLAALASCAHVPQVVVLEDPLSAEEHVTLGVAYERRGELEPAAREYERALRKDGDSFRARLNLGNVRLAQERCTDARSEYLKALKLRPADPEATNNLAWAAMCAGDGLDDALRRLDAVRAARPGASAPPDALTPALLDTRGVLLGRLGRRTEAQAALEQAEAACLAMRGSPGAGQAGPAGEACGPGAAGAPPPCPDETLAEIRAHREHLR